MKKPQLIPFREFCRNNGFGVTTGYKILKSGDLKAIKIGKLTFIQIDEAERWAKSLPSYTSPSNDQNGVA